jgi:hypothetical protein
MKYIESVIAAMLALLILSVPGISMAAGSSSR